MKRAVSLSTKMHPWNAPAPLTYHLGKGDDFVASLVRAVCAAAADSCNPVARTWLDRGESGTLRALALRALEEHDTSLRYHLRLSVEELLCPKLIPSLGLLDLKRIEVLVGSAADTVLQRIGASHSASLIERCAADIGRAGLGPLTRLSFVLGLPHETPEEALETVRFAVRVALMTGISEVRFEWWYNVPGSPLHTTDSIGHSEARCADWLADHHWLPVPHRFDDACRSGISEAIEVIPPLNNLEIVGPDIFTAPGLT